MLLSVLTARAHEPCSARTEPCARFVRVRACATISPSLTVGLDVGNKQYTKARGFFYDSVNKKRPDLNCWRISGTFVGGVVMAGVGATGKRTRLPGLCWKTCYFHVVFWVVSVCGEEKSFVVEVGDNEHTALSILRLKGFAEHHLLFNRKNK